MAHPTSRITAVLVATLATVGLAMVVPAETASAATASPDISAVPCGPSDYLQVWWHNGGDSPRSRETCYANAGLETFGCGLGCWLDALSTGNNVVQYLSDGRFQPSTPAGVNLDGMKIF